MGLLNALPYLIPSDQNEKRKFLSGLVVLVVFVIFGVNSNDHWRHSKPVEFFFAWQCLQSIFTILITAWSHRIKTRNQPPKGCWKIFFAFGCIVRICKQNYQRKNFNSTEINACERQIADVDAFIDESDCPWSKPSVPAARRLPTTDWAQHWLDSWTGLCISIACFHIILNFVIMLVMCA